MSNSSKDYSKIEHEGIIIPSIKAHGIGSMTGLALWLQELNLVNEGVSDMPPGVTLIRTGESFLMWHFDDYEGITRIRAEHEKVRGMNL